MNDSLSVRHVPAQTIDYSPLLRRLGAGETRRFKARVRREGTQYPAVPGRGFFAWLGGLGAAIVSLPLVVLEFMLLVFALSAPADGLFLALIGVCSVALTAGALYLVWREQPLLPDAADPWRKRLRLAEFAALNGFEYVPESPMPFPVITPGAVEGSAVATDRMLMRDSTAMEIGNVNFLVLSWDTSTRLNAGYFAIARPPHTTSQTLESLERALSDARLTVTVQALDEWIVFRSNVSFNLAAPQTYRVLLWIATLVDRRRGKPQPVSLDEFVAESRRLAQTGKSSFDRRFVTGAAIVSAVWLVALLVVRLAT